MNLRFRRLSDEIIFEMPNPGERDIPPPDTYILVNGKDYLCICHKRVYDNNNATGMSRSYFDIYVQTEDEWNDENMSSGK